MLADIYHQQQLAERWLVLITQWREQVDVRSQTTYTGASELHACLSLDWYVEHDKQYVEPDNLVRISEKA